MYCNPSILKNVYLTKEKFQNSVICAELQDAHHANQSHLNEVIASLAAPPPARKSKLNLVLIKNPSQLTSLSKYYHQRLNTT